MGQRLRKKIVKGLDLVLPIEDDLSRKLEINDTEEEIFENVVFSTKQTIKEEIKKQVKKNYYLPI